MRDYPKIDKNYLPSTYTKHDKAYKTGSNLKTAGKILGGVAAAFAATGTIILGILEAMGNNERK